MDDDLKAFGTVIGVVFVIFCGLVWVAIAADGDDKRKFMELCASENHTAFECEYAYRSSEDRTGVAIAPIPVFIRH